MCGCSVCGVHMCVRSRACAYRVIREGECTQSFNELVYC